MTVSCVKTNMNKNFNYILNQWPKSFISGTDLQHLLKKSEDSRYGIVKRAVAENLLLPLKRDLFLIQNHNKPIVSTYEISSIMYGPSYLSFESALSYHNWIPEAVRTTTCATLKRGVEFETPIGVFSYEHIPPLSYPLGVEQKRDGENLVFIANPWKAIADMIYARKRSWPSIEALIEDLRIEPEAIQSSDKELLDELIKDYASMRVKKALSILRNFEL